jgi:hypothetical protein
MKTALTLAALSATLLSGYAAAQDIPDTLIGPLPSHIVTLIRATNTVQVATCKAPFREVYANQKLRCEKSVTVRSDVKCPANLPNFTARNVSRGSDRDLCAKAGVVITSDGPLSNFRENVDYVFVPVNGVRNGVSFVASDAGATPADGWVINTSNVGSSGIVDRYQRILVLKTSPVLVNS